MSLVVQREKFYLLTRGGGVAKYSKLVNVKKLMESGGVYMIYDKSKGKSVAMDYVSLWIKDEGNEVPASELSNRPTVQL